MRVQLETAAGLLEGLTWARAQIGEYPVSQKAVAAAIVALTFDEARLEQMCRAHDAEDSSHMGEPSLWAVRDRGDFSGSDADWEEWRGERLASMLAALKAVGLA